MSTFAKCPGLIMGTSAYMLWGIFPLYFYFLTSVGSWEVLCHRIVWSVFALVVLLWWKGRHAVALRALRSPRLVGLLAITSALITTNWIVYIHAVATHRTIEASLGYFINPIVLILLGLLVFKERLNPYQKICITLAAAGVAYQVAMLGSVSWISLILPASFGLYGMMKKHIPLDSISSLFIETLISAPIAAIYLAVLGAQGKLGLFNGPTHVQVLLLLAGLVTCVPLILFAEGAQRLPLNTMGFLQYITPTLQFSIGLFVFGEPMNTHKLIGFIFVWVGLAILAAGQMHGYRARRELMPVPVPEAE